MFEQEANSSLELLIALAASKATLCWGSAPPSQADSDLSPSIQIVRPKFNSKPFQSCFCFFIFAFFCIGAAKEEDEEDEEENFGWALLGFHREVISISWSEFEDDAAVMADSWPAELSSCSCAVTSRKASRPTEVLSAAGNSDTFQSGTHTCQHTHTHLPHVRHQGLLCVPHLFRQMLAFILQLAYC